MEEIWKDVEGFEGLYQVSNKGRLKNIGHWVDRIYTKKDGTKVHDRIYIKEVILKLQKNTLGALTNQLMQDMLSVKTASIIMFLYTDLLLRPLSQIQIIIK